MPSNTKAQNKKQVSKKEATESTPAPVQAAPAQPEPVVEQATPVTPVEQPVNSAQQGGAKRGKRAASASQAAPAKKAAKAAPAKAAKAAKAAPAKKSAKATPAKKAAAKAAPKKAAPKKAKGAEADEESEESADGKRSFKAMLPGSDQFEGRYTGLTPYQAANKALSKYYRGAGDKAESEITFSIRESTRGSKRTVYTYNGRREKLGTPVEYTIKGKDGTERTVTKEFKNRLTKVKKADAPAAEASA